MPAKRLPMRKIKDVLRLRWGLGLTSRQAAASLGLARSTVAEYVRRAEEAGLRGPYLKTVTTSSWSGVCSRPRP